MSKIVSIHSFRGGTGKSNITANMAVTIAHHGHRVGIIDTDIQSPGIHVLFGLDEEKMDRTLNDYLWGKYAIEETAYDVSDQVGETTVMDSRVYLIPCSLQPGEIAKVLREGYDVGLLNDGFRALIGKLNLDYLFIDTHPGLNEETLLSIAISDALVIILRPDQQDYQGTAVTLDVAKKLGVPEIHLLVNKVLASLDFGEVRARVEKTFDVPVLAVLPLNAEMVQLGSAGVFCLRYPNHPFTHAIEEIAQALVDRPAGEIEL